MTKPLFVLGTFCCFVLGGCVATVQKSKIVDKAPEVESQYIPDIPSLPGVGGVNTPAPLPPSSR
jgi:hypothetical protein|tara:strand:- start:162 stop:353 length:192 start_codon:yes stop_codon:yes gene_type:complete